MRIGEKKRGFAAMSKKKLREISSKGGRISHETGASYEFNSETGRKAGKKSARLRKLAKKK